MKNDIGMRIFLNFHIYCTQPDSTSSHSVDHLPSVLLLVISSGWLFLTSYGENMEKIKPYVTASKQALHLFRAKITKSALKPTPDKKYSPCPRPYT